MANVIQRQSLTLRDLRGHIGKVSFYYDYDPSAAADFLAAYTAVGAILAAIEALSNALVVGVEGLHGDRYSPLNYGSNSTYANCETKARLTYAVAVGAALNQTGLTHIDIPAPIVAMFYGDKETVNPAYAAVATLTAALQAVDAHAGQAVTRNGMIYLPSPTTLIGGTLVRRKLQKRLTLYDKSPNLDEEEE